MPGASAGFPPPNDLFLILPVLAAGVLAMFLGLLVATTSRVWPPPDPWTAVRGPLLFWTGVAIVLGDVIVTAFAVRKRDRRRLTG